MAFKQDGNHNMIEVILDQTKVGIKPFSAMSVVQVLICSSRCSLIILPSCTWKMRSNPSTIR